MLIGCWWLKPMAVTKTNSISLQQKAGRLVIQLGTGDRLFHYKSITIPVRMRQCGADHQRSTPIIQSYTEIYRHFNGGGEVGGGGRGGVTHNM